jgi:transketolase
MDGSRIEESPLAGTPGFEITGGSLGQGLSQAVGMALGERLRGRGGRVYCLISDGELQESQIWEAAMSAGHYGLDNLVLLVDDNRMQADGATADVMTVAPIADKLSAFGFAARTIDANDLDQVLDAFACARAQAGKPAALVCETLPGKGVPSFEVYEKVHYIRAERWPSWGSRPAHGRRCFRLPGIGILAARENSTGAGLPCRPAARGVCGGCLQAARGHVGPRAGREGRWLQGNS